MQLPRLTTANIIPISTPLWNGGRRMVGINRNKVGTHNEIQILAENKDGLRIYPNSFYASKEQILNAPSKPLKNYPNVILHHVPIDELEFLERV